MQDILSDIDSIKMKLRSKIEAIYDTNNIVRAEYINLYYWLDIADKQIRAADKEQKRILKIV